jgi:hypothetical protein
MSRIAQNLVNQHANETNSTVEAVSVAVVETATVVEATVEAVAQTQLPSNVTSTLVESNAQVTAEETVYTASLHNSNDESLQHTSDACL